MLTKLALAVGVTLEARTPNTVELANLLPLETERQDMRKQWLRRLLKNPVAVEYRSVGTVGALSLGSGEPAGTEDHSEYGSNGFGDRFAILMVGLGIGDGPYLSPGGWKQVQRISALPSRKPR